MSLSKRVGKINTDMELNEKLQEIGNKNPFSVPEGYFENFGADMDATISMGKVSAKKLLKPWLYMAAMFVGLFLTGNVFYAVYQRDSKIEEDLYELYLTSQIDQSVVLDYYTVESNVID
jgi:hypothetical protein